MRNSSKIAIAAVLMLLGAALLQPVQASCTGANVITTIHAGGTFYTWSNPAWECGHAFGCYAQPFNQLGGAFWQFGTGQPAIGQPPAGPGGDNGSFTAPNWLRAVSGPDEPVPGYFYSRYIFTNWGPGTDGCNASSTCFCMLLTDQWGPQGYFAIISEMSTPGGDSNIATTDVVLQPIPKPTITGSAREAGTNNIASIQVTVPAPSAGMYLSDGCNCGGTFKVYARVLPRGTTPTDNRSIGTGGWQLLNQAGGAPQPAGGTPLGGSANLRVDCGSSNTDVYLGTQLVTDSGFTSDIVSGSSTKVECGPTIADPIERPKPNRPLTPRTGATRGR